MKIKKYLVATAICGSMVFMAHAVTAYSFNVEDTAKIKRWKIKIPSAG